MALCLLDTNILIGLLRGREDRARLLHNLTEQRHLLACCPITTAEVYGGMRPREQDATRTFMDSLEFLPITPAIARRAGLLRRDYAAKGRSLSIADTMIAAVSLEYHCTLVTENVRDFPMPELALYRLPG